ncbi:uncharacterized protein At4g02000-like [Raphanus sativus]|uniref:Uncharacterized protein At4g02000-like n=1 Tax=Raphanus sativus TaxID=3726 RepID=A0A6J0K867_RAPSA|nr:uncharacterized protein At4g02000-like [Raphanus sativus]
MSQSALTVRKGGPSSVRRKLDSEDEIIRIPACDLDTVADRFRLTLTGRVFHLQGRSIDGLIHLLPRNRIWNVEGRVRGINLGNGRFQFDFDNEADLLSVLRKRSCHFNQWSFALERWEPFTSESFPNTIPFWVCVTGVPVHFWNDQTFIEISKVLGKWTALDSKRARFQVSVNVDKPLQFERRLEFPNGDIGRVSFSYEGLFRYCYTWRPRSSNSNDYRKEDKRPRLSSAHDSRATRPNQRDQGNNREPRSPPKPTPYADTAPASSRAPQLEHGGPTRVSPSRTISDSQRTISDQLGELELGEANRGPQPTSPAAETEEERLRRIKGKAHVSDTPSSRDRDHRNRAAPLIIQEPVDANQASPQRKSSAQDVPATAPMVIEPRNLDTEMDLALWC